MNISGTFSWNKYNECVLNMMVVMVVFMIGGDNEDVGDGDNDSDNGDDDSDNGDYDSNDGDVHNDGGDNENAGDDDHGTMIMEIMVVMTVLQ